MLPPDLESLSFVPSSPRRCPSSEGDSPSHVLPRNKSCLHLFPSHHGNARSLISRPNYLPLVLNHLLRVSNRVMTSHETFTSGTSRILTVASLQRLKMEALNPALADCEVWSMIKILNAQSIAPIEIHRQLCQFYGHTWLDGQHISCSNSGGRCLIIIHRITRTSRPVNSFFSYTSRNSYPVIVSVFRMTESRR